MKRFPARLAALAAAALVVSSSLFPLGAPAVAAAVDPGRLSGVVRDETGAVLTGADVRLSTPSGPVAGNSVTDAGGRYSISVPTGLYDISVAVTNANGPWTALVKNMSVWSDTPLDLAVVRPNDAMPSVDDDPASASGPAGPDPVDAGESGDAGVTWQGRILDRAGNPVEPRSFTLEPAAGAPAGTLEIGGPDGSFMFTGPAGAYDLTLETGLGPWGGGSTSGAGDGLFLTSPVDLPADRADNLTLPAAAMADVVVAAKVDGRKRSEPLAYSAEAGQPKELAPGVSAQATVRDTIAADEGGHYSPLLFGRSAVTFTVPSDPAMAPQPVAASLEPGDRLAIMFGDRTTPPGAPQDVTASADDGRVKVTWQQPATDGGSPVTTYVVTASHGGSNFKASFPATATSGIIRNLVESGAYTITVTARNAKGSGPASAPVTVTLGTPDPPTSPPTGGNPLGEAGSGGDGQGSPPAGSGRSGYWLLGADGAVYPFGDAAPHGDASAALTSASATSPGSTGAVRAVDLEPTPSGQGYWVLDSRGRVHPFGDAAHLGDVLPARLGAGEAPASLSATRTGAGYWVFTNRGRALAFGDAAALGDLIGRTLNGPVLDSVATPSGQGYYMVAADGGIFAFGDARFAGSMGGRALNAPVRSLVPDRDGAGYWLVAADGGVFAFDAPFRGSMGGQRLNKPVRGMVRYGDGYLMVGEDGGLFAFSDLPFTGSLGAHPPASPIVSVAALG